MTTDDPTPPAQTHRRPITWPRRLGTAALIVVLAVACGFGFGITPGDWQRVDRFDRAVTRWQVSPDFRAVTFEYVDLGSQAMQTRICGVKAKTAIMAFRKIPGLPASIKVNQTSQSHYDDFSAGPWRAYFHLAGEQDVPIGIDLLEKLGAAPSDQQIRAMLNGFHLPVPIATDFGAVVSVRQLLDDVHPERAFAVRGRPFGPEKLHEADGYPVPEQMLLLTQLDKELRDHDPEAWRTKQVSDFLSGIWAQGYGQIYASAVHFVRIARITGRIIVGGFILAGIFCLVRHAGSAL